MITLPQHPEANQALGEVATLLQVRGVNAASYMPVHNHPEQYTRNRYPLSVMGELIGIDSPLAGAHQQRNLALAIATAVELRNNHGYNITAHRYSGRHSRYGLAGAAGAYRGQWRPGRCAAGRGPQSCRGVGAARGGLAAGSRPTLDTWFLAASKTSQSRSWPRFSFLCFGRVVVTPVDSPRSASLEDLLAAARTTGSEVEAAAGAVKRAGARTRISLRRMAWSSSPARSTWWVKCVPLLVASRQGARRSR